MSNKSSDYFAYKRNKFQNSIAREDKKTISKFNFLFQLFVATFIIIFISIVFMIMKYSQKIDIEYSKGELIQDNYNSSMSSNYGFQGDEQKKIDKRLVLIQQEENAPSEAKIIQDEKQAQAIIDPKHLEDNKAIEKQEKKNQRIQEQQETIAKEKTSQKPTLIGILDDLKSQKNQETSQENINITIMSKVLIGKYATFEEAQEKQNNIKAANPELTPFVRKIGDVYGVQMGSYQDFTIAKVQAQKLKAKGYDVWIYQQ